jgi:hypothetical protein
MTDPIRIQGREYLGREDWTRRAPALKSGAPAGVALWTRAAPGEPVAPVPAAGEAEGDRLLRFIISSERTDRYGDIVTQAGRDTSTYHDVVLWAHDYGFFSPPAPPIAKNLRLEPATTADGFAATAAVAKFAGRDQGHELAETIFLLARDGFPLDASIGFEPVEWTEDRGGYTFLRWNLIEWSVCPIGANTDARKLAAYSAETRSALQPLRAFAEQTLAGIGGAPGQWVPKATLEAVARALGQAPTVFDFGAAELSAALATREAPEPVAPATPAEPAQEVEPVPVDPAPAPEAEAPAEEATPESAAPADPLGDLAALLFVPQSRSGVVSDADLATLLRDLRPAIAEGVKSAFADRLGARH